MEEGMRHYFSKAMQAKQNNMKAETVDSYMQKAIAVAEKVKRRERERGCRPERLYRR